jgi:hypothetical protein
VRLRHSGLDGGRLAAELTRKRRLTPLYYMLKIFRDEMAKAAAPYCHPRLSTVDAKVNFNQSLAEALDEMDGWGEDQSMADRQASRTGHEWLAFKALSLV